MKASLKYKTQEGIGKTFWFLCPNCGCYESSAAFADRPPTECGYCKAPLEIDMQEWEAEASRTMLDGRT